MYEGIKSFIKRYPYSVPIVLAIVFLSLVWFYSDRTSNIDTTGIRNADNELRHAREYNQQSIDYNQRARDAITSSETNNERIEYAVIRGIEANQRTEESVTTSQELAARARADAIRAKDIISQSRSILERAEERAKKSEITTAK